MPFTPLIPDLVIDAGPIVAAIGNAISAQSVVVAAQAYVGQGTAPSESPKGPNTPRISVLVPSVVPDRAYDDNTCRMLADIAVTTQGRDTKATMDLAKAVQDAMLNHLAAPVGFTINAVIILGILERDPPPVADQFVRVRVVNTQLWFTKN